MPSFVRHVFAPLALCSLLAPISSSLADTVETEVLHNNVYQVSNAVLCQQPGACTVTFPATDHIQTVIQSVSCSMGTLTTATLTYAKLYYAGFNGFANYRPELNLPTFYIETSDGRDSLGIMTAATYFIPKGHTPVIEMNTNSVGGNYLAMHCTLSGYHS